jgi:hypothetical protein
MSCRLGGMRRSSSSGSEPPKVSLPNVGDWARILAGPHIGRRAKVVEVSADRVVVQVSPGAAKLAGTKQQVVLLPHQVRRLPR